MKEPPRVDCDESGFSIIAGPSLMRVAWSEVLEVVAYKQDCFAFDIICLGFRTSDDDRFWSVGEDYAGYEELLAELPSRFAGIREDWFSDVAFPAFVPNWTILWGGRGKESG